MWVEKIARFGYTAKGIVYGLVGFLAVLAAFTNKGEKIGTKGALQEILAQPFGQILLIIIACGLAAYGLWRVIQAIKDTENQGKDLQGILSRLASFGAGLVYGSLAITAIEIVLDINKSDPDDSAKEHWTRILLQQPFGQWLVATIGAVAIGFGFYKFYKAYKAKFRKDLYLGKLERKKRESLVKISRFGITAKGLIFVIIGFFFIVAARQNSAEKVKGLDGALHALAQQTYGKFLLATVAFGLVSYGVYMLVQARYRRIDV